VLACTRPYDPGNWQRLHLEPAELATDPNEPPDEQDRRVARFVLNRKIREASFRNKVLTAYDDTCAMTGVRMVNGGGNAEVQAAHIRPVEHNGPDVVQNGIALSATVHWMFDRGLVTLSDEYSIVVSDNHVPASWKSHLAPHLSGIRLPKRKSEWPHPKYLRWHRENKFGKHELNGGDS
jgi:putative restriction endonuclease